MSRLRKTPSLALVLLLLVVGLSSHVSARSKRRKPPKDMETHMCERGELLFSDDFSGDEISESWRVLKGDWKIADGALRGVELAEDDHAAVILHEMEFKNMILQFSFKFEGGKVTGIAMNNKDGHVCRLSITANGFSIHKDRPRRESDEEAVTLDKVSVSFKPGEWYTILLEVYGNEMVAYLDKMHFVLGEHEKVGADKTCWTIPVAGEGICFDDIRVWDALPNKKWKKSKKKMTALRAYLKKREGQK